MREGLSLNLAPFRKDYPLIAIGVGRHRQQWKAFILQSFQAVSDSSQASSRDPAHAVPSQALKATGLMGWNAGSHSCRDKPLIHWHSDCIGHMGLPQCTEESKPSEGLSCQYHPELCLAGPSWSGQRSTTGDMPASCLLVSVWPSQQRKLPTHLSSAILWWQGKRGIMLYFLAPKICYSRCMTCLRWKVARSLPRGPSSPLPLRSLLQMSSNLEQS